MANNAANFNRFIVTCKYIAEMSAASTLGFTRMIGRTDMWRSMFHRGEKFDQPLYDLLTFLVKHGYSREVALLNLEAQLIAGPKVKKAKPGDASVQNNDQVPTTDQRSGSPTLVTNEEPSATQQRVDATHPQATADDREKRLRFLDTVYILFEQIQEDDEFKKQLVELIHAFARENDLPSKIINVKKHAARMAKESSLSVKPQLAAIDEDLKLLGRQKVRKRESEVAEREANERVKQLQKQRASQSNKKQTQQPDEEHQPILDNDELARVSKSDDVGAQLAAEKTKASALKPQPAMVDNSDVLLANTKRNWKELRTRRDEAFHETEYAKWSNDAEGKLARELQQTRQAYLLNVLTKNGVLRSDTVEDGAGSRKQLLVGDVACPNSRYAVVWDLNADAQAEFKQRLVDERRREQFDPEYKMADNGWDVSIKSPQTKQSSKRIKKILKILALIFTVIMCIGEGIVPAAISGAVLVGICAFIINLPLIYRGLSVAFSHLFSGKMLRDKYGNPLPKVFGFNKRNFIIAAVINCMAAGTGYACLSFKYSHSALGALASLASSLATTKFAFLAPLVSLIAANPVLLAAIIAVSCFVSMSCLFYYYFGCGVRDGVVDGIKGYFKSRFVSRQDADGHEVKVENWERVVNALKLLLTLALVATTITLVFCYFSSLVTQFFQIPLEGTTFLAAAGAKSVGFVFSTAALLPNSFFIMRNMVRVTDFVVDTVLAIPFMIYNYAETWSAIKGYFQRVCEHPLTAYFHIKSALLIGAGVYMMKNNSFDGQSQGYARNARVGEVIISLFQKMGLSLQAAMTAVRVVILGHSGGPLMAEHIALVKTPYQTAFANHAKLDKAEMTALHQDDSKPARGAKKNIACRANGISNFWQQTRAMPSESVESIVETRYQSITASA